MGLVGSLSWLGAAGLKSFRLIEPRRHLSLNQSKAVAGGLRPVGSDSNFGGEVSQQTVG